MFMFQDMYGVFVSPDEYSEDFIDKEAKVYGNAFGATRPITATYIRLGGMIILYNYIIIILLYYYYIIIY